MEKQNKKRHPFVCIAVGFIAVVILFLIYMNYKTNQITGLLPQKQSEQFVFSFDYEPLDFGESDRWGIDEPIEKAKDMNPFTNYWLVESNKSIILSISRNDSGFLSESIRKKRDFDLPEVLPQNVSKIVFSEKGYQSLLDFDKDKRPQWCNCTTVCPDFTQEEIIDFVELFLQSNGNLSQEIDENIIVGVQETGRPYLWHIRLYFNSIDGVFYNSSEVLLCKTQDDRYYLSFDQHKYIEIPEEMNQKIQIVFTGVDFGQNVVRI